MPRLKPPKTDIKDIPSEEISARAWGDLMAYLAQEGYGAQWFKDVIGTIRRQRTIDVMAKLREAL